MIANYAENKVNKVLDLDKLSPIISKCLQILKNKIVFLNSVANLVFFTSLFLGVLVYGLIHPSKKFWLTYGPMALASASLTIQMIVCFICSSNWQETKLICITQFPWDLKNLPLETKNKIVHMWKQIDAEFVVGCVIITCVAIAVLKENYPVFWDILTALDFMEEYVPHFKWIVTAGIAINAYYMAFMMHLALYYVFVPGVIIRQQVIMLYSMVEEFKKNTPKKQSDKYVAKNLKYIIKMHQNFLRKYYILKKDVFIPLFLISISLLICFLYNAIVFQSPYNGIVSPVITYTVVLIFAAYFCYQGQKFEDQYDDFFNSLYDLNWYEWNINNMKTFKILFLNASVPIPVSDVSLFRVNHDYFKESIKIVYTMVNLARTCSHK